MSDYRRLISYIYEYEGKEKGKNVGFAKLEARNGQCRVSVNVKKVYVSGNAIGVYLLGKDKGETFLGNIFVRGGNGEFRTAVDVRNVEGSGKALDTYHGLTVHDVKNPWRSYTTIWEDVDETGEKTEESGKTKGFLPMVQAAEILPSQEAKPVSAGDIIREIEEEIALEEERKEMGETAARTILPEEAEESEAAKESEGPKEPGEQEASEDQFSMEVEPLWQARPAAEATQKTQQEKPRWEAQEIQEPQAAQEPQVIQEPQVAQPSPELENPAILRYLQETEDLAFDPERLWNELKKSYPKIQPFDYDGECEILTIRPQDIGRLPREAWVYGNNSFLLHGYYNFRYLILVRLGSARRQPRYLLGVPGHYYSNEKYMAAMFGFANFVLSKKQPPNDGRFGYWYTDIKIR